MSRFTPSREEFELAMRRIKKEPGQEDDFKLSHTLRLTAQGGSEDPHTYRAQFEAILQSQERSTFNYELRGTVDCREFEVENYLFLKRRHLLWPLLKNEQKEIKPNFAIERIKWSFTSDEVGETSPSSPEFKEKAEDALGKFLRDNEGLKANIVGAIRQFYSDLDRLIGEQVPAEDNELKLALGLVKDFGVYGTDTTSDILYLLFGERLNFYNGDTIRIEDQMMLVPNYWVREHEKTFEGQRKQQQQSGYGMRVGVIDFGRAPYPWAFIRINHVHASLAKLIHQKVGFSQQKASSVSGRQVFIIACRDGKVMFKLLADDYFGGGKLADDRIEILASLALGQLEAEAQSSESTGPK